MAPRGHAHRVPRRLPPDALRAVAAGRASACPTRTCCCRRAWPGRRPSPKLPACGLRASGCAVRGPRRQRRWAADRGAGRRDPARGRRPGAAPSSASAATRWRPGPTSCKTYEAMQALDLTRRARHQDVGHRQAAPTTSSRRSCRSRAPPPRMPNETIWGYGAATTGYPDALRAVRARAGRAAGRAATVIEEWELFYGLAQRLGLQLRCAGVGPRHGAPADDRRAPRADDCARPRIPLGRGEAPPARAHLRRPVDRRAARRSRAGRTGSTSATAYMIDELAEVAAEPLIDHAGYTAPTRCSPTGSCSAACSTSTTRRAATSRTSCASSAYNPAFMHPDDLGRRGLRRGRHHRDRLRPRRDPRRRRAGARRGQRRHLDGPRVGATPRSSTATSARSAPTPAGSRAPTTTSTRSPGCPS